MVCISRAPVDEILARKDNLGWASLWYSSDASDFKYDYHTGLDNSIAPLEYNCMDKEQMESKGFNLKKPIEMPGCSGF
jgi:predicted dithiol-disulfide oxidoreductase (DUF899 family)